MEDKTILDIANEKLLNIDASDAQAFIDKFKTNVNTCVNGLKCAFERNLHNENLWRKYNDPKKDTYLQVCNFELKWNNRYDTRPSNTFTYDITRNIRTGEVVLQTVGFNWSTVYTFITLVEGKKKGTYEMEIKPENRDAYEREYDKQSTLIKSGQPISKFEGIGVYSQFIRVLEKYVQDLAIEHKKKFTLTIEHIISEKLRQYGRTHGYTDCDAKPEINYISQRKIFAFP